MRTEATDDPAGQPHPEDVGRNVLQQHDREKAGVDPECPDWTVLNHDIDDVGGKHGQQPHWAVLNHEGEEGDGDPAPARSEKPQKRAYGALTIEPNFGGGLQGGPFWRKEAPLSDV